MVLPAARSSASAQTRRLVESNRPATRAVNDEFLRKGRSDHGAIGPSPTRITPLAGAEPRARRARKKASGERPEPDRGPDDGIRRIDVVRLHPRSLVRRLDRIRRREVPVWPPNNDRLSRGNLPLDLRDDQPEQSGHQTSSGCRPAMADRQGRRQAEPRAAQPLQPDPRTYESDPHLHEPATRRQVASSLTDLVDIRSRIPVQLKGLSGLSGLSAR